MAIVIRTPVQVPTTAEENTLDFSKPGDLVDLDQLLTAVGAFSEDGSNKLFGMTAAGHTELEKAPDPGIGAAPTHAQVFSRAIADAASEPANVVFTDPDVDGWSLAGSQVAIGGANASTPFGQTATDRSPTVSATVTLPEVDTTLPDSVVLYAVTARRAITISGNNDPALVAHATVEGGNTGQTALRVTHFLYSLPVAAAGTVTGKTLTLSQAREWEAIAIVINGEQPAKNDGQDYELDNTHPLYSKIGAFVLPNNAATSPELKDLRSGSTFAIPAEFTLVNDANIGYAIEGDGTQVGQLALAIASLSQISFTTQVQYQVLAQHDLAIDTVIPANENYLESSGSGDDGLFEFLRSTAIGGNRLSLRAPVGANNDQLPVNDPTTIDASFDYANWNSIAGSRDSVLGQRFVLNGIEGGRDAGVVGSPNQLLHPVTIGRGLDGRIAVIIIWNSELSTAENALFADPNYAFTMIQQAAAVPGVTADQSSYGPGATATLTPVNFGQALQTAQFRSQNLDVGPAITITANQFAIPGWDQFMRTGSMEGVKPNINLVLRITDGVDTVDIADVQISMPENLGPVSAGGRAIIEAGATPYPVDTIAESGTLEDDLVVLSVVSGQIAEVNDKLVVEYGSPNATIDRTWFENAAADGSNPDGRWSATDRRTLGNVVLAFTGNVPDQQCERGLPLVVDLAPQVTGTFDTVELIGGNWPLGATVSAAGVLTVDIDASVGLGLIGGLQVRFTNSLDPGNPVSSNTFTLLVEESVVESVGTGDGAKDSDNNQLPNQSVTAYIITEAQLATLASALIENTDGDGTISRLQPGAANGVQRLGIFKTQINGQDVWGIEPLTVIRR